MRRASVWFCSTHSPVSAKVARMPRDASSSRIADVCPASEPASKVSATASSDASPIQMSAAGWVAGTGGVTAVTGGVTGTVVVDVVAGTVVVVTGGNVVGAGAWDVEVVAGRVVGVETVVLVGAIVDVAAVDGATVVPD